jgi:hypothetical protein
MMKTGSSALMSEEHFPATAQSDHLAGAPHRALSEIFLAPNDT